MGAATIAGSSQYAAVGSRSHRSRVALLPMRAETLKGHLDGLLLACLEAGPRHGYAIMEALRSGSGGQFDLPTGTVYPALRRQNAQARCTVPGTSPAAAAASGS